MFTPNNVVLWCQLGTLAAYFHEGYLLTAQEPEQMACTAGIFGVYAGNRWRWLLVDAGYGVLRSLSRFAIDHPNLIGRQLEFLEGLVITHYHLDHCAELVALVESRRRLNPQLPPLPVFTTSITAASLERMFPWVFGGSTPKLQVTSIAPGVETAVGDGAIRLRPVDAADHCPGGVALQILAGNAEVFAGWDLRSLRSIPSLGSEALLLLEGNTFEPHERTGHTSIAELLNAARQQGWREFFIVHHSGFEDGATLGAEARRAELQRRLAAQRIAAKADFADGGWIWQYQEGGWHRMEPGGYRF